MGWHACSRPLLPAALAGGLLASLASSALGDEATYCVICKNPDQSYRCHVVGEGSRPTDALKLYCIIRVAKDGNHASCSAERKTACSGKDMVYNYEGPAIPPDLAADPRVKGLIDRVEEDQQAFEKPKGNGPKTLVELGGRAVTASRNGIRNARDRIGGSSETQDQSLVPSGGPLPLSVPAQSYAQPPAADITVAGTSVESESRVKRASSAVGGFARKSYRCMRSLFRQCSEEATEAQGLR